MSTNCCSPKIKHFFYYFIQYLIYSIKFSPVPTFSASSASCSFRNFSSSRLFFIISMISLSFS